MNTFQVHSNPDSPAFRLPRKLLLASAITMILASGGAALGQDDKATMEQQINNARQEAMIETTYTLSPYLRANDIEVMVMDGKATLNGTVEDDVNKDLAKEIALSVEGVESVDNQIEVRADYSPAERDDQERSFGDKIDDASITAAVKSKLIWSQYAEGFNTNVNTLNGKVTLLGTAESGAARELAATLAADTDGVTDVDNQLVIEPREAVELAENGEDRDAGEAAEAGESGAVSRAGQSISDTWITTKVKSNFMLSKNINGRDISVETTDGVVTLTGTMDDGVHKELAVERTRNIRGVKEVIAEDLVF